VPRRAFTIDASRVTIRIFISSPNDFGAERDVISEVAREHNDRYGSYHGYTLDVVRYEQRTSPGVGSPQQYIYDQVGGMDSFHIVVGLLGQTVGKPDSGDKRLRSGTQQELEDAIAAFRAKRQPEVMLYLKKPTGAGVDAYADELKGQLLRCRYESVDEFRRLFDQHLLDKTYKYILPRVIDTKGSEAPHILRRRMCEYWFDNEVSLREVQQPVGVPMRIRTHGATLVESTTSVIEVYERAMKGVARVAITGGRGSGKSFALFALMRLAMQSPQASRVPVYLAATDWLQRPGARGRTMEEWLLDELHSTYKLKRSGEGSASTLIEDMALLPFIDGMDELLAVDIEEQEARFDEFKTMLAAWSQRNPVVITCEASTWDARVESLEDDFAVITMLPFEDAAEALSDSLELKRIVSGNEIMQELCKTPLAIALLRRLHPGLAEQKLENVKTEAQALGVLLQNAFETGGQTEFPKGVRERALKNIAKRLQAGKSFEIEKLQAADFGVERRYRVYAGLGLALAVFVLVAVPSFLSLAVERHLAAVHQPPGYITDWPLLESLFGAALAGALGGLIIFIGMLLSRGWLSFGIAVGAAFGCARGAVLGVGLFDDLSGVTGLSHGLRTAATTSAVFAAVMVLIFWKQKLNPARVRPFDVSVGDVRQEFLPAARWAVPAGLAVGALFGILYNRARALSFGAMVAVAVETMIVVASRPIPRVVRPNQGIRVSLEASVKIGCAALIAGPVCFGLGYWTISPESAIVNAILGMNVGLVVLLCGGLPVIQHYALRAALDHRKILPYLMVSFCEECVHLGMLKRAGHRYQFAHEYVRRYFAGDTPEKL